MWEVQRGTFTENCCIKVGTNETERGLKYVSLSKAKKISLNAIIFVMPRTIIGSLNNNAKYVLYVEHKAVLLRRSKATKKRLSRTWQNT